MIIVTCTTTRKEIITTRKKSLTSSTAVANTNNSITSSKDNLRRINITTGDTTFDRTFGNEAAGSYLTKVLGALAKKATIKNIEDKNIEDTKEFATEHHYYYK